MMLAVFSAEKVRSDVAAVIRNVKYSLKGAFTTDSISCNLLLFIASQIVLIEVMVSTSGTARCDILT